MKLLLDTHVLLWAALGDARLDATAREAIVDGANIIHVSAASVWEIAIKSRSGRPTMSREQVDSTMASDRLVELPITIAHANQAGRLPLHHRDPFDRMLVAQAQLEGARLVTHDKTFAAYDVDVLWT